MECSRAGQSMGLTSKGDALSKFPFPRSGLFVLLAALGIGLVPAPVEASGPTFIRGECNGDGQRNVADAILALGFLFGGGGNQPPCLVACDVNDDGDIDLADPILLLGFLFGSGATIPQPSDQCGVDPTPDFLTCFQESDECNPDVILNFTTIAGRGGTGIPSQETIIRDPVDWQVFWAAHAAGYIPAPPLPAVDFATEMVLVIIEPVTAPETRIEVTEMISTLDPLTLDPVVAVSVLRTYCPSPITILNTPWTFVVADLAPGDPVVQAFDGGCPP